MSSAERKQIPCCRPLLPRAERVLPYLRRIDATRWYTNFGPLLEQFEERLARHFGVAADQVTTASSGTAGLTVALAAQRPTPGGLCLLPSWTFSATAHAAIAAGLRPCFIDVDPTRWAVTPQIVESARAALGDEVAAVICVAPFGAPLDVAAWDAFRRESGLPTVIDAAAGFDTAAAGDVPSVVSLHATKVFGVGEGACVLSRDRQLIEAVVQRSNFGFFEARHASVPAFNAKMSEYHAAVGLAGLDEWPAVRRRCLELTGLYLELLQGLPGAQLQPGFGAEWVTSTPTLALEGGEAQSFVESLAGLGIEARRWWGDGCHQQLAFRDCPATSLETTERLASSVISLPYFHDMQPETVRRVALAVGELLSTRQTSPQTRDSA